MRRTFGLELGTGLFMLLGLGALFFIATQATNFSGLSSGPAYTVTAAFNNVGGLKKGAAVELGGVRIGTVGAIRLDPKSLQALVTLRIDKRYNEIPTDSSAGILTRGLLGDQYVGITPGGALKSLKNGATIHFTRSAIVLEKLIGQFLFNKAPSGGNSHANP